MFLLRIQVFDAAEYCMSQWFYQRIAARSSYLPETHVGIGPAVHAKQATDNPLTQSHVIWPVERVVRLRRSSEWDRARNALCHIADLSRLRVPQRGEVTV